VNVAAIDIGSNSVRLLIADTNGVEVVRDVVVTGLGSGVDRSGILAEERVGATIDALTRLTEAMSGHDVARRVAVATSASRDAVNGPDVMQRFAEVIGIGPKIITGDREAALSFSGATGGISTKGSTVVVDIGGGSTELVVGRSAVERSLSYDMGSVRLTDRVLGTRPASQGQIANAMDVVDETLGDVRWARDHDHVIGVAGTFTSLSAINLGLQTYDRAAVHDSVLTKADIGTLVNLLRGMTVEETEAIPSLDPMRAPVILAGAVVAERVLKAIGAPDITVSEYDLLDGLVNELIAPI